jgi:hypothetical protein
MSNQNSSELEKVVYHYKMTTTNQEYDGRVTVEPRNQAEDRIQFEVERDGPGMPVHRPHEADDKNHETGPVMNTPRK